MGNHYAPDIDGPTSDASKGSRGSSGTENIVVLGKGQYRRSQLLYQVVGPVAVKQGVGDEPEPRRIWPDEPNVGFYEEDMAFSIDGALRIGGPSLKTYILNDPFGSRVSRIRETRIEMDDTYYRLRGSEDGNAYADVFNAVGCWTSQSLQSTPTGALSFDTEIYTDSRAFLWNGTDTVAILRPGVYDISYRLTGQESGSVISVQLLAGSESVTWLDEGSASHATVTDMYLLNKTTTSTTNVQIIFVAGKSIGEADPYKTILRIVKLR